MRRHWIAALACLAAAGCGSEPQLTSGTAGRLHDAVTTVREAAADGDRDGALRALDRLEERVISAERDGELTRAEADAISSGITHARSRVRQEVQPPAAATPTSTPTPKAKPEPAKKPKPLPHEKGKPKGPAKKPGPPGKGKGKRPR
jgi:hypothetical protein